MNLTLFQRRCADRPRDRDDDPLHGQEVRRAGPREALRRLSQAEPVARQRVHAAHTGKQIKLIKRLLDWLFWKVTY